MSQSEKGVDCTQTKIENSKVNEMGQEEQRGMKTTSAQNWNNTYNGLGRPGEK